MDKYLKQLLEKYAKVILPSFGAIVVENEETGNLMFNEYLSYNDGKLDDLIVSESNMELQEAQNMIAKYIRDIQVQIDKGESYDIFELGRFYKNDDGDIEFEGNLKEAPKSQDKKEPTKATTAKEKKEQPKEEAPNAKESKKESKPAPKKEEPVKEDKVDSKTKKDTKPDAKSAPKENKFVAKKEKEETKVDKEKSKPVASNKKEEARANKAKLKAEEKKKKEEAKANKARLKAEAKKKKEEAKKAAKSTDKTKASDKAKNDKTPKDPKAPKKKKRFGAIFWILIVVLGLASAGLIYVGLNYNKVKSYMGWNEFDGKEDIASTETQEETEETDSDDDQMDNSNKEMVADTTEASNVEFDEEGNVAEENNESQESQEVQTEVEPEPEPEPQLDPVKTASNGTHHLIAGSFSDKSNAEGLVQDLKAKGLDARILGQFGGLHFVAAASYNSLQEAKADLDRVRGNASGAWIFKYNDN